MYDCVEADEVDGIEEIVDAWTAGLWDAFHAAVKGGAAATPAPQAPVAAAAAAPVAALEPKVAAVTVSSAPEPAAAVAQLVGVPPLAPSSVQLKWVEEAAVADRVRHAERQAPSPQQLQHVDAEGHYDAQQPYWARLKDSRCAARSAALMRIEAPAAVYCLRGNKTSDCAMMPLTLQLCCWCAGYSRHHPASAGCCTSSWMLLAAAWPTARGTPSR